MTVNLMSERNVTALNFLLVAALAYFAALAVSDVLARRLSNSLVGTQPLSVGRSGPASAQPRSAYDMVAERDVFNAVKEAPAPPPPPVVAADLHIRLVGTSHLTLSNPFAIIEDQRNNQQSLYRLHEQIPDAGELVEIEKNRIIIDHGGTRLAVEIPKDELTAPAPLPGPFTGAVRPVRPPPMLPAPHTEGIRQMADNRYQIDRSAVDSSLQNMSQLFTQIRAIPNVQNGKSDGFRLSEIQPGSVFQQIGLQDGDVVTSIGGEPLTDPAKAMELLGSMRNQSSVAISVMRNGRPVDLNYQIR